MDLGEIVESGKHEDLLKLDGAYKTLMERQMNNQGGTSPSRKQETTDKRAAETEKIISVTPTKIEET